MPGISISARGCCIRLHESGWETLDYRVEAALTRADLARNLLAAGDPAARSAAEHTESLRRELGLVPLLRMGC